MFQPLGPSRGGNTGQQDAMDTRELGDDLLKGSASLVGQFSKQCSLTNLINIMPAGYAKELLSNRQQGDKVKEGLVISMLQKYKVDKPGTPPPPPI